VCPPLGFTDSLAHHIISSIRDLAHPPNTHPHRALFTRVRGRGILRSSPSEVATRHTKIRHLGYMHGSSSVLQSDQSLSRAPFESPPPKSSPASLLCAPILCGSVSYVQNHKPIDVYIRNIILTGTRLPRRRSWSYRGGAMLNFRFTEF
jgi:hypothetical protein